MKKFHRELIDRLTSMGVEDIRLQQGRKHARLSARYGSKTIVQSLSVTPSDRRSIDNVIGTVRRQMRG